MLQLLCNVVDARNTKYFYITMILIKTYLATFMLHDICTERILKENHHVTTTFFYRVIK